MILFIENPKESKRIYKTELINELHKFVVYRINVQKSVVFYRLVMNE